MSSIRDGAVAELVAASSFVRAGYSVWWPLAQSDRADFMVSKDGRFLKIQVKKARLQGRRLVVKTVAYNGGRTTPYHYQPGDFDFLAAVSPTWDRVWVIPFEKIPATTTMRLDTPSMDVWLQQ